MKHPKNFRVVNLLMLTVAGIINAFGITIFLTPVKLYDSGISGTSMLLEQFYEKNELCKIFIHL